MKNATRASRPSRLKWLGAALVMSSATFADENVHTAAEAAIRGEEPGDTTASQPAPPIDASSTREWVVAPIPTYDPSQRLGLQLVIQYIFRPQSQPMEPEAGHPSVLAAAGFYTQEDSRGMLAGYRGHLRADRWRPAAVAGVATVNYDFYGVGNELAELDTSIPVSQDVSFGLLQLSRRTWRALYIGLRGLASSIHVNTKGVDAPPITVPPMEKTVHSQGGGLVMQWDSRDNQFYPTSGTLIDADAIYHGGDVSYETYALSWNQYVSLRHPGSVLALRASIDSSGGDIPFYAMPQFGRRSDLRGFKSGKYRDENLVAVQAEYRRRLGERWGVVGFAGIGEVAPSFGKLNADDILMSAGIGLRFRLARNNPVNLRIDGAYGNDGGAMYVAVGEAF